MRLAVVLALAFLAGPVLAADELVVCGWDEVFILDVSGSAAPRKVWSWKAADRPELPSAYRDKFRTTDDCKPVSGNRILVTASSDGVALIDRASGKTTFWGLCANAHSAELLPGERIAVACSVRPEGGNRLAVFDARQPEQELFSTELFSGHGVTWDETRRLLWALSGKDLRAYSLASWDTSRPRLKLESSWPLPDRGGHELTALARTTKLAVTTLHDAWLFDRETKQFTPHPELAGRHHVKSISVHPGTGQIAFIQASDKNWWSNSIEFLSPNRTIPMGEMRLYKIRWNMTR